MSSSRRPIELTMMPGMRGRIRAPELRRIVRQVLDAEKVAPEVETEVVLADAPTVRELNRLYRGKDEATDVLSFASHEGEPFLDAPDAAPSLGEVVICVPYVDEQVARGDAPAADAQIAHLLVHGLLHLLGHDHELGEVEAGRMTDREEELLAALGYAGQYAHGH